MVFCGWPTGTCCLLWRGYRVECGSCAPPNVSQASVDWCFCKSLYDHLPKLVGWGWMLDSLEHPAKCSVKWILMHHQGGKHMWILLDECGLWFGPFGEGLTRKNVILLWATCEVNTVHGQGVPPALTQKLHRSTFSHMSLEPSELPPFLWISEECGKQLGLCVHLLERHLNFQPYSVSPKWRDIILTDFDCQM